LSDQAPVHRAAALLAAHTGGKTARTGAMLNVPVDRVVLDAPGTHAVATSWRRFSHDKEVTFGERFVCVDGGRLPRKERPRVLAFAAEHGLKLGLDPQAAGWPSTVAAEEGYVGCDDVIMAERSDVCALGGLGALVVRGEAPGLADLLGRRTMPIPVPESKVVEVRGRLPRWTEPFDLAHFILDEAGGRVAVTGKVLELQGDTISALHVEGRMALCRALAQAGVSALVAPDDATDIWLRARRAPEDGVAGAKSSGKKRRIIAEAAASAEGSDKDRLVISARKVRFVALERPFPGDRLPVGADEGGDLKESESAGKGEGPLEQIIVGGQLSELRTASEAMRERRLAPGIHLVLIPASRRVLLHALEEGLLANFIRAGATVLAPGSEPPPAPRAERRITTMPTGGGDILVSPVLAGASAVMGRLIDPESMRRILRRKAAIR
jgi:3-isopropylmalate/(R)-2-methylmalate dehydratase large subunit